MRQALKIKCWHCGQRFTMNAELSNQPGVLVETVVPCPFCEAGNQVIVHTDQVQSTVSYKDGQSVEALSLERPGALLRFVFEGIPPLPEGLMYYPPRPIPDPPPPKPTPPEQPTSSDHAIPPNKERSK